MTSVVLHFKVSVSRIPAKSVLFILFLSGGFTDGKNRGWLLNIKEEGLVNDCEPEYFEHL